MSAAERNSRAASSESSARTPFTAYQKQLFVFLSVACFFEGYDFFALSQLLPNLRDYFHLSPEQGTYVVGFVNMGTVLAFAIVKLADRWGRRRVLTLTILGYTLCTLLTAIAPNAIAFTLFQLLARVFLIGEWATSMVIAAEEYPAARRGLVIGVVSAATGFGSILCAGVVPALLRSSLGWRAVYFVGVIPLLLVAYARRSLRETARFEARQHLEAAPVTIWKTHARRVVEVAALWLLCYICTQNSVTFWKEFAVHERGLTDAEVGGIIALSALISLPVAFFTGYFLDLVGRRLGGTVIFVLLSVGVFVGFTATSKPVLTLALILATIGNVTTLTVLNTITTELFPTSQRGAAFAWSNNLLGRIGYWGSPFVIGQLVKLQGWGPVVRSTAIFPLIACALLWLLIPETRGRELEEITEPT